eukprot:symbB.v1.2.025265.t1/scaffold2444.1/size78941/6
MRRPLSSQRPWRLSCCSLLLVWIATPSMQSFLQGFPHRSVPRRQTICLAQGELMEETKLLRETLGSLTQEVRLLRELLDAPATAETSASNQPTTGERTEGPKATRDPPKDSIKKHGPRENRIQCEAAEAAQKEPSCRNHKPEGSKCRR